ncbi:MAG: hypothetical protein ACKVQU_27425 [Burkholderiales bacterium]
MRNANGAVNSVPASPTPALPAMESPGAIGCAPAGELLLLVALSAIST